MPVTPATKNLLCALVRQAKGALSEFEKWLLAQEVETAQKDAGGPVPARAD